MAGHGHDLGEGFGDVACPGPLGGYPQVAAALAFDDPLGGVQDPVAQSFRLHSCEVAVEGEEAEPGEQVTSDGRGLAPCFVDLAVPGRQVLQPGGLGAADPVLAPGLGTMPGFEELGLPAGRAGGGDLVSLAVVLFEQR